MIIYVDVLVIVNIYITYFTLKASARLLHLGYKTARLILASVLGGISALTAVIPMGFLPAFMIRFILTAAINVITFGLTSMKKLLIRSCASIASAALVCGGAILLREWTGSSFFGAAGGYAYFDISVMTLIISTTAVYVILTLFRRLSDRPAEGEMIKLSICHNNRTAIINAYPDSGNNLRDFLTGLPVIVCRKEKMREFMPFDIDEKNGNIPSGVRLIPFTSVGGSGVITAFRPDSVTVSRGGEIKRIDALIGTGGDFSEKEDFDAILNPKILI